MIDPKMERSGIEARAEKFIKKGKFKEAIVEYQKLLTGGDQDIPIRNILGDLYVKLNQKDNAVEEFQRIANYYENEGIYPMAIAVLKRIIRLNPDDINSAKKLAQLFCDQGFFSEAKIEYMKLADKLNKYRERKEAILIYKKLLEIDRGDISARLTLADLYTKEGGVDQAVDELNEVAEFKMRNNALKEANKILNRASALNRESLRTIANRIELYKRENKKNKAFRLIDELLKRDKDNFKALYLLGCLHYEEGDPEKAEPILSKVVSMRPKQTEARVKLGKIYIQKGHLDKALELFDPLIETLLRKQKENKAVGLLGLILTAKKAHIPTLERMASIYREKSEEKNLELVCSILLNEYKKNHLKEKMLDVLRELVNLSPENEDYYYEYKRLEEELQADKKGVEKDSSSVKLDETQEIIETNLSKVQLYIEQGLIKNAERILDYLKDKYPGQPQIKQKIAEMKKISSKLQIEEIPERLEKVKEKETQLFEDSVDADHEDLLSSIDEVTEDEKVTAAEIFAETDITPLYLKKKGEKRYYDLSKRVTEELTAIRAVYNFQVRGDTIIVEKSLSDIVSEFRSAIKENVDIDNYESHYHLAIAFLEQDLFDEAIKECKTASKSKFLEAECLGLVSYCYRKKGDFSLAIKWVEKALAIIENGSPQWYALEFELASLYEEMNKDYKAYEIYKKIKEGNPKFGKAKKKIKDLEKKLL